MITREDEIEHYERVALVHAWRTAGQMADGGGDILAVAGEVAKLIGVGVVDCASDATDIREAILDALSAHCQVEYGERGDRIGTTLIAGERAWWIDTNACTEWYSERPEWWDEQVAQYEAA